MQFLLLFKADASLFDDSDVEQAFRSVPHFHDLRFDTPVGDVVECEYVEPNDRTLISLDQDRQSIFFSNTGCAALRAALIIQQALGVPMRLYDDTYTFDRTFSDIATVEELEVAIENARTS